MELKMQDEEFLEDVTPLLRPEIEFDPREAYPLMSAMKELQERVRRH